MRDRSTSIKPIMVTVSLLATLSACSVIPERQVIQDKVDISTIPDAVPKMEPLSKLGNPESYVQSGKRYWIIPNPYNYKETGLASWYGTKFQGKRTSSGETYDMYKMTAAHKTLPLPTYVRVTSLTNNNTIVVRVNDRGPFKDERIIDLSYAAAKKLGISDSGTDQVEVKVIDPMQFSAEGANGKGNAETTGLTQSAPLPVESIPATEGQPQAHTEQAAPTSGNTATGSAATASTAATPQGSTDTGLQGMAATEAQTAPEPSAPNTTPNGASVKLFVQVGAFGNAENAARLQSELNEIQSNNVIVDSSGGPQGILHRVQIGPFNSEEEARKLEAPLKNHGIDRFQIIRKQ